MTTNQPRGGSSSTEARSHGRRQKAALTRRRAAHFGRPASAAEVTIELPGRLSLDRRPGFQPLVVVHAVLLAVAAVGERRLPELQRAVVGEWLVRVVRVARALLDRLHELA